MEPFDLYYLLKVLRRKWLLLIGPLILSLGVGTLLCFLLPPIYYTEATLVPLNKELPLLTERLVSLLSGPKLRSTTKITAVLQSRSLRERVIKRLDLLPQLFPEKWDQEKGSWRLKPGTSPPNLLDGAQKLKRYLTVETDKTSGTILFKVEFPKDPDLTYQIAKTALQEARIILQEKTFSLAHLSRQTLERRLAEVRKKIVLLEKIYRKFSAGELKNVPLLLEEGELGGLVAPLDKETLQAERNRLKKLKKDLENKLKKNMQTEFVPIPEYQFNLIKLRTQINAIFELYTLLLREYEMARIEDVRESLSFQILDPPFRPRKDKPYKPQKFLILGVALVGGMSAGLFLAFFSAWLESARRENLPSP